MSLVFELFKGFFLGLVAFFAPIVIATAIPRSSLPATLQGIQDSIRQNTLMLVHSLYGRAILVIGAGGFRLKQSQWSSLDQEETTTVDGRAKHFEDPNNKLSRLAGRPFGIALEARGVIVDISTMDLGAYIRDMRQDGRDTVTKNGTTYYRAFADLSRDEYRAIDPRGALAIIRGGASPDIVQRTKTFVEKMHQLFDTHPTIEYLMWFAALGIGFGLMYFAKELGGNTSGGVVIGL